MPCDTPPPPLPFEAEDGQIPPMDDDADEALYEMIDMDELDDMQEDDSYITLGGHTDSIFCCSFDKTGRFFVSGGQDETAFVWSLEEMKNKFECTGHTESVISANFSPDSNYVSTADMKGLIQVWDVNDGSLVWNFDTFEILWSEWLHNENVILAGSVDGNCWKWSMPDGIPHIFEHANSGCCMGSVSHNDKLLVTGYQDGTLKLLDLQNNKLLHSLTGPTGHKEEINALKFNSDDSLIISGSSDETAKLIKTSDFKVLWTINACPSSHSDVSVEAVSFCQSDSYIATGSSCGCLCIWDIQTKTKRNHAELEYAVVKIITDETLPILYAASGESIYAFDVRTCTPIKVWKGHRSPVMDFALSSDKRFLLSASDDQTCKLFERGSINT